MRLRTTVGVIVMAVAIGCCVLLGTVGWFATSFDIMTDCTSSYDAASCSAQSCAPCAEAGRWINGGAIAQWLLAGCGLVLLVRSRGDARLARLMIGASVIVLASVVTAATTSSRASDSYCQPRTAEPHGYCSTDS